MAFLGKKGYLKNPAGKTSPQKTSAITTQQMIEDHARQLWEKMGKPQGQDLAIWLKAEKDLLGK